METQSSNTQTNTVTFKGSVVDGQLFNPKPKHYVDGSIGKVAGILVQVDELSSAPIMCNFTLLNSKGVEKSAPGAGEQVNVYITKVPSTTNPGGFMYFKEVGMLVTDNAEVDAKIEEALAKRAEEQFKEQGI